MNDRVEEGRKECSAREKMRLSEGHGGSWGGGSDVRTWALGGRCPRQISASETKEPFAARTLTMCRQEIKARFGGNDPARIPQGIKACYVPSRTQESS